MLRRRIDDADSVEAERTALRDQWAAVDVLKRELTERVRAVEQRERELQAARQDAGAGRGQQVRPVGAGSAEAAPATDLERREAALTARARQLAQREQALEEQVAQPAASPDERRLAEIETRLADLKEAEKMFLRTQQELSARSEALAARERMVGQRERELDQREDVSDARPEVAELEARLRKLEQRPVTVPPPQPALDDTQGFSGGFRKLQEQGTRRRPGET